MTTAVELIERRTMARQAENEARKSLAELGLNPSEFEILYRINANGTREKNQGELQHRMHCAKSTMSELLDGLEKRGLVKRAVSNWDRRQRLLELTPDGKQLVLDAIDSLGTIA